MFAVCSTSTIIFAPDFKRITRFAVTGESYLSVTPSIDDVACRLSGAPSNSFTSVTVIDAEAVAVRPSSSLASAVSVYDHVLL